MICALLKQCGIAFVFSQFIVISTSIPIATRNPRLSLVDWTDYNYREHEGPGTYAFGYDIEDAETNNIQYRHEERHPNGTVTGSYGYVGPDGNVHMVNYVSDNMGYRAKVETIQRGTLKPITLPETPFITEEASSFGNPTLNNRFGTFPSRQNPYYDGRIVTPDIAPGIQAPNNNINNNNNNVVSNNLYGTNQFGNIYQPIWPNFNEQSLFNEKYKFH